MTPADFDTRAVVVIDTGETPAEFPEVLITDQGCLTVSIATAAFGAVAIRGADMTEAALRVAETGQADVIFSAVRGLWAGLAVIVRVAWNPAVSVETGPIGGAVTACQALHTVSIGLGIGVTE